MNSVIFKGNITKDTEMRYSGELAIASTSIAINSGYGDKKRTDYFNLVAFGKTAELFEKHISKGSQICVRCHAQQNVWEDKNGNKRYDVNFVVDELDFCGKSEKNENKPQKAKDDDFVSIPDGISDMLPFS